MVGGMGWAGDQGREYGANVLQPEPQNCDPRMPQESHNMFLKQRIN